MVDVIFLLFFMIVCWLIFVFCFCFYVFWHRSLSNQEPILTFLLSFWLIIKLYHYYHDSAIFIVYKLVSCVRLNYFTLLYSYLFRIVIILFVFSLLICYLCYCIYYHLIIIFPARSLQPKYRLENVSFCFSSSQKHENTFF